MGSVYNFPLAEAGNYVQRGYISILNILCQEREGFEPRNLWLWSPRPFTGSHWNQKSLCLNLPSEPRQEPRSQMALEFNPCKPTWPEGQALEPHAGERSGLTGAEPLFPGTRRMGRRIHHSLWQAAWPGNNPRRLHFDQEARSCFSKSLSEFYIVLYF